MRNIYFWLFQVWDLKDVCSEVRVCNSECGVLQRDGSPVSLPPTCRSACTGTARGLCTKHSLSYNRVQRQVPLEKVTC